MGDCRQRNDSLSNNDTDEISVLCHKVNGVDAGEDIELHTRPEVARTGEVADADTGGGFHRLLRALVCWKKSDDNHDDDGEQDTVRKGKAISTVLNHNRILFYTYI